MTSSFLSTIETFKFLRKYKYCCPVLQTTIESTLNFTSMLKAVPTDQQIQFLFRAAWGGGCDAFLLKSTITSLVFQVFSWRTASSYHSTKSATSGLCT